MQRTLVLLAFTLALFSNCQSTEVPPKPSPEIVDGNSSGYKVSKEKYETSLKDIRELTIKLNAIIQNQKLTEWVNYLDSAYLQTFSDPAKLREISQSPVFKQNNIRLRNLAEYFTYVVGPSRSNAQVDDITFLDEERVEAWMYIKNQKVLLYQLKLYGKEWKISFW